MRKCLLSIVLILMFAFAGFGQSYKKTDRGVIAQVDKLDIEVQFFSPSIVRVIKVPTGQPFEKESLSVIKQPESVAVKLNQQGDELSLKSAQGEVVLNLGSGVLIFRDAKGRVLLTEKAGGAGFRDFNDAGNKTYSVQQSYLLDADEAIYGLGILQNGKMSQRNQEVHMVQNNTWDFVTFFQSVKGYGLFWDN